MEVYLKKSILKHRSWTYNALLVLPESQAKGLALIAHGFTSHKGSILSWATKMAEEGLACGLFDIPGHYLGSYNEVEDTQEFKNHSHEIFLSAYNELKQAEMTKNLSKNCPLIICGHSLGALLALKAGEKVDTFQGHQQILIGVGLGMGPKGKAHIFDAPFYKSTLKLRGQLVSPTLSPDIIFPWVKEQKEELELSQKRIHLITGEDDVVVGKDGVERLAKKLEGQGNHVTLERPKRLPHHQPDMAAPHIKKFLKDEKVIG